MRVTSKQNGAMAFEAHTESGHRIQMDASPEVGGDNRGARPMELLLAGLAGCTSIDVIHILRKARQNVADCVVEVTAERAETDPKIFTRIHVQFTITGDGLSEARVKRAVELSAEQYCSASIMLAKTAEITHGFELVSSK